VKFNKERKNEKKNDKPVFPRILADFKWFLHTFLEGFESQENRFYIFI
jgi:hypothetical protein